MPQSQDNARFIFLIILLFWMASPPDNGPGFVAAPALTRARLHRQRHGHSVLNSTRWGDFSPRLVDSQPGMISHYLNLTGFREQDGYAWEDFGRFRQRCDEWTRHAVGDATAMEPVWQNVSGVVRGSWVRRNATTGRTHDGYNLTEITPEIEWSGRSWNWARNVTGHEGKMLLRVEDVDGSGTEPEQLDHTGIVPDEIRAREVSALMTVDDENGVGSTSEMRLHGVHWPRQGTLLLTTTSEKFAGIFGLPHLAPRADFFQSSQALLNRTIERVLARKEKHSFSDPVSPWASSLDAPGEAWNPSPHCEYVVYVQVHPPDKDLLTVQPSITGPENVVKAIQDIESELRFPLGAPQTGRPRLRMSAVVFSPDCGFFLETKGPPAFPREDGQHLMGWKQELWLHSVSHWLLGFALIIFCQVQLLKMQMKESSTPSTLGRISFYTGSMMLLVDGMVFTGVAALSLSASDVLLPSLVVTGASFLAITVGVAFLGEIYKVQESEWRRRDRERQSTPPTSNTPRPAANPPVPSTETTAANSAEAGNTLLSTAARRFLPRTPSPQIIIPSDQDIDAEIAEVNNNATLPAPVTAGTNNDATNRTATPLSSVFGRFIMIGIAVLFLSLAASTWRPRYRAIYYNTLAFVYLSLWTPQIYRNVYRNCRRALSWRFVIGQSCLRLLPIAYFYVVKDNFAFAVPDYQAFAVLVGWVWVQVWILVAQNVLGPRFGVPSGWMPEAWEYHPVLREDNVESGGLPIGLVLASAPSSPTLERKDGVETKNTTRTHTIDCAICRETLDVPVVKAGVKDDILTAAGGVAGVFARRAYMVTPCRHIFHSPCLEGWMRFRLQCPICREELPPL